MEESWQRRLGALRTRSEPLTGVSEFPFLDESAPTRQISNEAAGAAGPAGQAPGRTLRGPARRRRPPPGRHRQAACSLDCGPGVDRGPLDPHGLGPEPAGRGRHRDPRRNRRGLARRGGRRLRGIGPTRGGDLRHRRHVPPAGPRQPPTPWPKQGQVSWRWSPIPAPPPTCSKYAPVRRRRRVLARRHRRSRQPWSASTALSASPDRGDGGQRVSLRRLGGASRSGPGRPPRSCGWSCAPAAGRSSPSACGPRSSTPPARPTASSW